MGIGMSTPCITVRFVANHSLVSAAIRHVTGSLFSHVEGGTPQGTWIGALADGIKERPADYCKPFREYTYRVPCTQEQADRFVALLRSKIGTKYNFRDILGLALGIRGLNNPTDDICSELLTWALIETLEPCRVLNVESGWEYRVTPEMLHLSPLFVGHLAKRVR